MDLAIPTNKVAKSDTMWHDVTRQFFFPSRHAFIRRATTGTLLVSTPKIHLEIHREIPEVQIFDPRRHSNMLPEKKNESSKQRPLEAESFDIVWC